MVCEFLEWSRRIVTFAFFRLVDLDCMFRMDRVVLVVWLGGDVGGLGSVGVLDGCAFAAAGGLCGLGGLCDLK